jgi:hypothetical protein
VRRRLSCATGPAARGRMARCAILGIENVFSANRIAALVQAARTRFGKGAGGAVIHHPKHSNGDGEQRPQPKQLAHDPGLAGCGRAVPQMVGRGSNRYGDNRSTITGIDFAAGVLLPSA